MFFVHTSQLTSRQQGQLQELFQACAKKEPLRLSCPLDGDDFFLLYSQDSQEQLWSAAAIYREPGLWECRPFTRPSRRRQGLFRFLLEQILDQAACFPQGEPDLCFVTDGRSQDGLAALNALDCTLWYEEHAMVLSPLSISQPAKAPEKLTLQIQELQDQLTVSAMLPDGTKAGSCSLFLQHSQACLWGVEIVPHLRGRGIGTRFVKELINCCCRRGIRSLCLQVSGNNEPAMKLYKKTGFRITETLSYYLY